MLSLPSKRKALFVAGVLVAAAVTTLVASRVLAVIGHQQGGGPSGHVGHGIRQPTAVTNGLVAWYPLDGNAKDYSGNGYDVALGAGTAYVQGKFGKAVQFSGSTVNSQAVISPSLTLSSFTTSAWFSPNPVGSTYTYYGLMASNAFSLVEAGVDGHYTLSMRAGRQSGYDHCEGYDNTPLGTYRLLTATVTASTITLYVNSVSVASCAISHSWDPLTTVAVGPDLYVSYFGATNTAGSVDDARLYGRVLAASEIANLYAGSSPFNCDQYCAGWWKFDEVSGTTAKDSTSNGNTGTLTNFSFDGTTSGWTSGVFGNGLHFNGNNTYVDLGTSTFQQAGDSTVTAWVNTSGSSGGQSIFSTWGFRYTLGLGSSLAPYFQVFDAGTGFQSAVAGTALTTGQWHHLVAVKSSVSPNLRLYVDGALAGANNNAPNQVAYDGGGSGTTAIGGDAYSGSYFEPFNGSIDDVRVYSRALTDYEIYDQYSAGR